MSQSLTHRSVPAHQLYGDAELALVGEVRSITTEPWGANPGASRQKVVVDVTSTLKGTANEEVTFYLPGGTYKGVRTHVFGVPDVHVGDRAFFLFESVNGDWVPLSYTQGIWPEPLAQSMIEGKAFSKSEQALLNGFLVMSTGSGADVHWSDRCVDLWLQDAGSNSFTYEVLGEVLTESFDRWAAAQGNELSGILRGYTCFEDVGISEWPGRQNLVQFRESPGSWIHPKKIAGLTTVMYREETGELVDADIEFNLVNERFTVDGSVDSFSLRYTMTHEIGHLLGLDHSTINASIMAVNSVPKHIDDFVLHADDKNAIVANYPAGQGDATCGDTSFFAPADSYCPSKPESEGCSGAASRSGAGLLLSMLFLMVGMLRRRT